MSETICHPAGICLRAGPSLKDTLTSSRRSLRRCTKRSIEDLLGLWCWPLSDSECASRDPIPCASSLGSPHLSGTHGNLKTSEMRHKFPRIPSSLSQVYIRS
uniref:Uncharacterized protein n=1 Tax=Hymenochirus boettgeri TaxID=247094 RepID=A0A8T2I8S8_9PIPI|nr:hypothetical protein GDO86_018616 [Hymenochirus boettgeri]